MSRRTTFGGVFGGKALLQGRRRRSRGRRTLGLAHGALGAVGQVGQPHQIIPGVAVAMNEGALGDFDREPQAGQLANCDRVSGAAKLAEDRVDEIAIAPGRLRTPVDAVDHAQILRVVAYTATTGAKGLSLH